MTIRPKIKHLGENVDKFKATKEVSTATEDKEFKRYTWHFRSGEIHIRWSEDENWFVFEIEKGRYDHRKIDLEMEEMKYLISKFDKFLIADKKRIEEKKDKKDKEKIKQDNDLLNEINLTK